MAVKEILTHLDLKKANELQNALIHKLATAPESPVEGQIYYDTATHKLYYRNNAEWVAADASNIIAGNGLTRTGSTIDVVAGTGIAVEADKVLIDTAVVPRLAAANTFTATPIIISHESATFADGKLEFQKPGGTQKSAIRANGANLELDSIEGLINLESALHEILCSSSRLKSVAEPVEGSDAATKSYVDGVVQGLDVKASVRVATTAALATNTLTGNVLEATANGALEIDGKAVEVGDRILVKNEAEGKKNGIYVVKQKGGAAEKYKLERSTDADKTGEITSGTFTWIEEGTTNADSGWAVTTDGTITLNTTATTWAQFSGAGQITAGTGLTKTGNTLNVIANADNSIKANADDIQVNSAVVPFLAGGNVFTSLQTIKTETDGLYIDVKKNARALSFLIKEGTEPELAYFMPTAENALLFKLVASDFKIELEEATRRFDLITHGNINIHNLRSGSLITLESFNGTGTDEIRIGEGKVRISPPLELLTEPTAANHATTKKYVDEHSGDFAANVGNGAATSFELEHKLGSRDVQVEVYRNSTPWDTVDVTVERTSTEKITVRFNTAPTSEQFRVHVTR